MRKAWPMLALVLLAGCAGLPQHVDKHPSYSLHLPQRTALARIVAASAEAPGTKLSGVRLLASGEEAFFSLIALADHAERTLDIQYYIIRPDESARLLMEHVRRAADRGVRVRVLVDDLNTAGEDRRFLHLSHHANVEVRVFNPFPGGRSATWSRILASISDIRRINHRMHNKLFVADNECAITGGRNIGDEYFTRDKRNNFIDLDVVVAGPVVAQLSSSFDAFWNSKYAYPLSSVAGSDPSDAETFGNVPGPAPGGAPAESPAESPGDVPGNARGEAPAGAPGAPFADPAAQWLERDIDAGRLMLDWVPATALADGPAKIASDVEPEQEVTIASSVATLMRSAQHELDVISPYFIPGEKGVALMRELTSRGVHIRVLTNSLASTDAPLVYNGYARYRPALLEMGVELFEVRAKLGQRRPRFHPFSSSNASLHAKALVVDRRTVFIGSLNLDGRSARFNSELGLVMRSPDLAAQVTALLDDMTAEGSYRLALDRHGRILWSVGAGDSEEIWHIEPDTTRWQRLDWRLLAPFAPEQML